jgi:hypothetical protein
MSQSQYQEDPSQASNPAFEQYIEEKEEEEKKDEQQTGFIHLSTQAIENIRNFPPGKTEQASQSSPARKPWTRRSKKASGIAIAVVSLTVLISMFAVITAVYVDNSYSEPVEYIETWEDPAMMDGIDDEYAYLDEENLAAPQLMAFGQLLQFPCEFSQFTESGWSLRFNNTITELAPGETQTVDVTFNSDYETGRMRMILANPGEETIPLQQAQVIGYDLANSNSYNIYLPHWISPGDSSYDLQYMLRESGASWSQQGVGNDSIITIDFPSDQDGYNTWRLAFEVFDDTIQGITGQYVNK